MNGNESADCLHFTTDAERATQFGTVLFIVVSTSPYEDGSADTQYVIAAVRIIGKQFALWGFSFKAKTDDVRKATSRDVISDLLAAGARVTAYDPVAMNEAKHCFPDEPRFTFAENQMTALEGADALIIVTVWRAFRSPDFEFINEKLKNPVIVDGRNLYSPKLVRAMGFQYLAIGR